MAAKYMPISIDTDQVRPALCNNTRQVSKEIKKKCLEVSSPVHYRVSAIGTAMVHAHGVLEYTVDTLAETIALSGGEANKWNK